MILLRSSLTDHIFLLVYASPVETFFYLVDVISSSYYVPTWMISLFHATPLDMSGGSFQSPSGPPSTSLIVPLQSPPGRKYIIVPASLLQRQQSPSCINGTAAVSATGHPNLEMVSEIASVPNNISPVQVRTVTTVVRELVISHPF